MLRLLLYASLATFAGCAFQSYSSKPIDALQSADELSSRSVDSAALRDYMMQHGVSDWPVKAWGLNELTLLAFYYHSEIEVVRAQAEVARAQSVTARQPLNPGVDVGIEHHSIEEQGTPWTLKFYPDIPIVTAGKGDIQIAQADYLAQAAELNVGSAAWRVRSQVYSRLLDFAAAHEELKSLRAEAADRNEVLQLLEKRVALGMIGSHEAAIARTAALDVATRLNRKEGEMAEARAAIADALGVPAARDLNLVFDIALSPALTGVAAARREALFNRLDIRKSLLEYAAAEAALELEIARQYPDFSLGPGYEWDQKDNVWALAISLILPLLHKNEGPILEAREKRELKAREFTALQSTVIAQTESAVLRYENAQAELEKTEALRRIALEQKERVKNRFDAGDADRLDWVNARLQVIAAEQARLATLLRMQRARGALEDSLQRPLEGALDLPQARSR
jgi:outer membrane protein TolC